MCEKASKLEFTDAWIAAAKSAMTSMYDSLGELFVMIIKRRRADDRRTRAASPHFAHEEEAELGVTILRNRGDEDAVREELRDTILELLGKRAPSATICPSEAPRALHPENWRDLMDITREVARQMALNGRIEITQKGRVVDPQDALRGPIRLRLASGKTPSTS